MYACTMCFGCSGSNKKDEQEPLFTQQPQSNKESEGRKHENNDVQQTSGSFSEQEQRQKMIMLQRRVKELEEEKKEIMQILSPNQLVKLQSKRLRETGSYDDLSDKYSNTKLREQFSRIKKNEWFQLHRALHEIFKDEELRLISFISEIMKSIYEDCKNKAVNGLAYGNKNPSSDGFSVNEFRKRNGQTDVALANITMELKRKYNLPEHTGRKLSVRKRCGSMDSVLRDLSARKREDSDTVDGSNECSEFDFLPWVIHEDPDILKTFECFFVAFVKCSWLMVVSNPPIELHFAEQAVGKTLDKEMEKHFEKYPTNERVTKPKTVGTIIQIMWPELDDNHGCHTRGFVVTVDQSSDTQV